MRPRLSSKLSLKGRALQILAQREHSLSEMRRKLLAHIKNEAEEGADAIGQVQAVLDWLQANRYLCEERFAESRVHARAARYGNLRIRQELAQHGVALSEGTALALKHSEFDRAREVWQRRFGELAVDAADRARQMRFLAGRGFSRDVIRRVVQGQATADGD